MFIRLLGLATSLGCVCAVLLSAGLPSARSAPAADALKSNASVYAASDASHLASFELAVARQQARNAYITRRQALKATREEAARRGYDARELEAYAFDATCRTAERSPRRGTRYVKWRCEWSYNSSLGTGFTDNRTCRAKYVITGRADGAHNTRLLTRSGECSLSEGS